MNNYKEMLFIDSIYRPKAGAFGKPRDFKNDRYTINAWFSCRELWHTQLYGLDIFFFSHKLGQSKGIAAFFNQLEELLNIKNKSEFGPTQRKTVMYIRPSKWWTKNPMRRSLFTIFLRCAGYYSIEKDNFYLAIFCDDYALRTRTALSWFLDGNTVYTGKKTGWLKQFEKIKVEEINKLLIKSL